MNITERVNQLLPDIQLGLITDIEVNKNFLLYQKRLGVNTPKTMFSLRVDLFYRRRLSYNEKTKPKLVLEVFSLPRFMTTYEIKRNILLHKSRNIRLIEHWSGRVYNGKSKTRSQYREGRRHGVQP
jgi:hypothetical protein